VVKFKTSWGTFMKIPLGKGGWQRRLLGGCPSVEITGQVGTETLREAFSKLLTYCVPCDLRFDSKDKDLR
jgi:hypothetical protein